MRALEVSIHNFRSILDVTIRLEDLSLIAGANNAGKSNVIDAIRLFYGDLKWSAERDTPKVPLPDSNSWVEIEFLPSEVELLNLKDDYRSDSGTFRVRNYVSPSRDTEGKKREGYYAYEKDSLSENLFYGAKNVGSGKIGDFIYIPAVSKIDDNTKLSGPSVLRDLVAGVLNKVVENSPAYKGLSHAFEAFEGEIKTQESEDGQSLRVLEKEITNEIQGWDASFSLGIQSIQPDDIIKTLIRPQLIDETHGGEIDQARFGAGFQRHLIFTLIRLAARYANPQKSISESKKEFSPRLSWLLFEEPEAFLHPSQEEVLYDDLLKIAQDGSTQVLLTTHSSRFVSRSVDDLTRLIRLRRERGITTAHQLNREELDQMFQEALVADVSINPIGTQGGTFSAMAGMSALKLELWLQPTRSSAFFSNRVILVEGPSETALYAYLVSRGYMKSPARGIVVVDSMGKYNIHRFVSLLGAFGIAHSVMYDGDGGSSHDVEVTAAIYGAKTEFTKRITRFSRDLETELGLTSLSRDQSHRKPQYILYNLSNGNIASEKILAIAAEFEALATLADADNSL